MAKYDRLLEDIDEERKRIGKAYTTAKLLKKCALAIEDLRTQLDDAEKRFEQVTKPCAPMNGW